MYFLIYYFARQCTGNITVKKSGPIGGSQCLLTSLALWIHPSLSEPKTKCQNWLKFYYPRPKTKCQNWLKFYYWLLILDESNWNQDCWEKYQQPQIYKSDTTHMTEGKEELKSLLIRVKKESAKDGLKLNIQKTRIIASSPITL